MARLRVEIAEANIATNPSSNTATGLAGLDRCEIFVLIDNVSDALSSVPEGVTSEFTNLIKAGATSFTGEGACCACFGLSLVITATKGSKRRCLLFDAGPASYGIEGNVPRLGIDMGAIDAAVLSHGHIDHAGGLPAALRLIHAANGGKPTPVYANADMFVHRGEYDESGDVFTYEDIPSPETLAGAGGEYVNEPEAALLLDDLFYLSGEIPRVTSYERGLPEQIAQTSDGDDWAPDPWMYDERFLAVNIKDKGVFVFSACSHAGIVNVLTHAREVFDPIPLYGVMGGFHLAGSYMEPIIPETVADLRKFDLQMIVPGHCTGWRAVHALLDAFGEEIVIPSAVGRLHELTANSVIAC